MENKDASLDRIVALKSKLETRLETLSQKLAETQKQLTQVQSTLDLLQSEQKNTPKGKRKANLGVSPAELKGMTQPQALAYIAEKNNGRLEVAPARLLLVDAGIMKGGKNASNVLFSVIDRSDRFERIKRGEYKLRPEKNAPEEEGTEIQRFRRNLMSPLPHIVNS